jgi:tripartite-type tricarboxylate transporter receptor subunit TctC
LCFNTPYTEDVVRRLHGLFLILAGLLSCTALAQTYPSRPIRMIVPQAPGNAKWIEVVRRSGAKID